MWYGGLVRLKVKGWRSEEYGLVLSLMKGAKYEHDTRIYEPTYCIFTSTGAFGLISSNFDQT